jgi:hypothetical protein
MPTYGPQMAAFRDWQPSSNKDFFEKMAEGTDTYAKQHQAAQSNYDNYVKGIMANDTLDPVEKQRRLDGLRDKIHGTYSKYDGNIAEASDDIMNTIVENRKDPYWTADTNRTKAYRDLMAENQKLASQGLTPLYQDARGNYINDINSVYGSLTDEYGNYKPMSAYNVMATKQMDYEKPFHEMFSTIKASMSSLAPGAKIPTDGEMAQLIKGYFTTGQIASPNGTINKVLKDALDRYQLTPEYNQMKGRWGDSAAREQVSQLADAVANQYRYSQTKMDYSPVNYTADELKNKKDTETEGLGQGQVPTHEIYNKSNPYFVKDKMEYKDGKLVNTDKWTIETVSTTKKDGLATLPGATPDLGFRLKIGNESVPKAINAIAQNMANNLINANPNLTKEQAYNQVIEKLQAEPEAISGTMPVKMLPISEDNRKFLEGTVKRKFGEDKNGKWNLAGDISVLKVYDPTTGTITSGADEQLWKNLNIATDDIRAVTFAGMFEDGYGIRSGEIYNVYKNGEITPTPIYIEGTDPNSMARNSNKKFNFQNEVLKAFNNDLNSVPLAGHNKLLVSENTGGFMLTVIDKEGNVVDPSSLSKAYGTDVNEAMREIVNKYPEHNITISKPTKGTGSSY